MRNVTTCIKPLTLQFNLLPFVCRQFRNEMLNANCNTVQTKSHCRSICIYNVSDIHVLIIKQAFKTIYEQLYPFPTSVNVLYWRVRHLAKNNFLKSCI